MILFKPNYTSEYRSIEDDSPNYEAYTQLYSVNQDYFNIMKEFYVVEYLNNRDGSEELVTEALGDIFDNIIKWLIKFKDMIIDFFKAIFRFLEAYFMETEKYFNKYKDKIDLQGKAFKVQMYEYDLNLIKKMPDTKGLDTLVSKFNNFDSLKDKDPKDMQFEIHQFSESLDKLRGEISTLNRNIEYETFREDLREELRKGNKEEQEVEIDTSKAKAICNSYKEFKQLLNDTRIQENKVLSMIEKLKAFFEAGARSYKKGDRSYYKTDSVSIDRDKGSITKGDGAEFNKERFRVVELHYKYAYEVAKAYNEITYICFQEKMNAIKEAMKKYRQVGREAIIKSGFNTKEMKEVRGDDK